LSSSSSCIHNNGNSSIWTGSLRFGEQIVESIDLYPPMRECSKPSGLLVYFVLLILIKINLKIKFIMFGNATIN
jgi:hypothetical protein